MEEIARAIREAVGDSETWRIHTEDEILARYAKHGLALRSLDDVRESVPLRAADKLAIVGVGLPGIVTQLRNRGRFRGRLTEEIVQLISEACIPLVHNAAVYGYRAGAPHERALALWVLAAAVRPIAGDWSQAPVNQDGDESIGLLADALARAKDDRRRFTGMRPLFGDFNGWFVARAAQASFWTYRERHLHEGASRVSIA